MNNSHVELHFVYYHSLKHCAQKLAPKYQGVICFEKIEWFECKFMSKCHVIEEFPKYMYPNISIC
jgi:hypothetical protein